MTASPHPLATHGKPSDENAHPHKYAAAVVHNGIIRTTSS